jgi:Protein of unknown function (DUF2894)
VNPVPCSEQLAALRQQGAQRFDPVRFHYLELLAQRALEQPAPVQKILQGRLEQALAEWQSRQAQAHSSPAQHIAPVHPGAAEPASLRALAHYLAQQSPHAADEALPGRVQGATAEHTELKSVRHFRNTWSKLSVDRQVAEALKQAPKNAGPINSHMLVLRSLALMRDISPDYLNRFMSYVDTLLSLEHNERAQHTRLEAEASAGKKAKARHKG